MCVCVCVCVLQSVNVAFMNCADFEGVKSVYITAKRMLGEVLSGKYTHRKVTGELQNTYM